MSGDGRRWFADADSHLYEPRDAFTRHLDPRFAATAIAPRRGAGGERVMVGDRPLTFLDPLYDEVPKAGALRAVLRHLDAGVISDDRLIEPMAPEYQHVGARLAWMDRHRIELAVVVPSLGGVVETYLDDDAAATWANLRAFNRWLRDDWGFATDGRVFTTPMVSLLDCDAACAEIEWLAAAGARFVHLRPGPAGDRSPADPHFDPFWARVEDAGLVTVLHISESSYNRTISTRWSEAAHPNAWSISAFQWTTTYGDRPVMDTVAAFVLHNLFGRFPALRVLSLENGSMWVPYLLAAMDKMQGMGRRSPWIGGRVTDRASDIARAHLWVSPFHEEDHGPIVDVLGIDRVVMGTDFPHPEGVVTPDDYLRGLRGGERLSPRDLDLFTHDNLAGLVIP